MTQTHASDPTERTEVHLQLDSPFHIWTNSNRAERPHPQHRDGGRELRSGTREGDGGGHGNADRVASRRAVAVLTTKIGRTRSTTRPG